MIPDSDTVLQRYPLLCRALQATPDADDPQWAVADRLGKLEQLVHEALLELARQGSPDDFADIYLGFTEELRRFREFCAEPRLASKTIVAFGGAFSAGKSSLINALVGQRLMVTEVDPTTALPAYLFAGDADAIHALNLHGLRVPLTNEEFLSLTHDEPKLYGSEVARALTAAFVTRRDFPWGNLAFIDTPGYTDQADGGARSDARIAQAQLAGAHAIVWTVSIKQGDLTESDLHFLSSLDTAIPRIVAVTRADLVTEENRQKVVAQIRETLITHNLPVVDVIPVSARPREAALLEPLRQQLDAWNQSAREQRFAHRFKALFVRYQRGLEREMRDARWQLHRANRLATLADGDTRRDAEELQQVIEERVEHIKTIDNRLTELRGRFFTELKRVGDLVGVPLPEPYEIDLLDPGRSNLLEQLVALREREGKADPDLRLILAPLAQSGKESLVLKPLPTHALAEKTEHLRRHYALILAALLTAQPEVSKTQTNLLRLLLDSLKLGDIRAALFEEVRALTPEVLLEAARLVREAAAAEELLVDALVLLRLPAPLTDDTSRLIAELAAFLGLDEPTVATRVRDAQMILGLACEGEDQDDTQTASALAELWPAAPRPLTTAALKAGLTGGIWRLDHDLTVTFPWRAKNAVLLFHNGAQLKIDAAQQGEVSLTNCRLHNPRMTMEGEEEGEVSLTVNRCTWQGRYDPEEGITALRITNVAATISDSTFTLSGACAIEVSHGGLTVTDCQFVGCGSHKVLGGAILLRLDAYHNITNCRFEACTAAFGGAIFVNNLRNIRYCEFVRCTSPYLQKENAGDIALYASSEYGDRVIKHCVFRHCSLYVDDYMYNYGEGYRGSIANHCQFDHGNLFQRPNDGYTIDYDCNFTNGQLIERHL